VGSRGCQLLKYQLLPGPLQRTYLHQTAHPTKENLSSNALSLSPPKLSDKEGQHPLPPIPAYQRSGRDTEKALVKSVSTWIRNQRKKNRTIIELRSNPFLSIMIYI
jgi:hypothetical protein